MGRGVKPCIALCLIYHSLALQRAWTRTHERSTCAGSSRNHRMGTEVDLARDYLAEPVPPANYGLEGGGDVRTAAAQLSSKPGAGPPAGLSAQGSGEAEGLALRRPCRKSAGHAPSRYVAEESPPAARKKRPLAPALPSEGAPQPSTAFSAQVRRPEQSVRVLLATRPGSLDLLLAVYSLLLTEKRRAT